MLTLNKINKWLDGSPPKANGKYISFSILGCAFTYLCLGLGTKYFTVTATSLNDNNLFIKTLDIIWVGYIFMALSCLLISHYFKNTAIYKNSIFIGVMSFIYINLFIVAFIFFALFITSLAGT